MKVLVTGGTSLLGAAVAGRLEARGDEVVVFQRRPNPQGFPEVLGDIADPQAIGPAVGGAEAVIHLAARVGVSGPMEEFERVNVDGTAAVLAAARAAAVGRIVHVSSPSVAHTGASLVGAEAGVADPEGAKGPYASTKARAELLALEASTERMPVVAIRPHLVWGPGDTQLVGRIVERARAGRLALVGSGSALIDTTYVDNAADALVSALDRTPALAGRALVISNGEPRTVRELVERIVAAAGLPAPRVRVPAGLAVLAGSIIERIWDALDRTEDPPMTRFLAEQLSTAHWFDQRDARVSLKWTPQVPLDEGFHRLEAWFAARA